MPEIPEVITITKDLRKEILGETLIQFEITNSFRKISLSEHIKNKKVKNVFNLGKQIIIDLENNNYLLIHLGMTGQLLLNKTDQYEKTIFYFTNNKTLYFSDIRKFGHLKVIKMEDLNKQKTKMGVNILETYNKQKLIKRFQNRKIPIKNALLEQNLISGAGNIYATDALFLSKLHPNKPANTISEQEYEQLFKNLQKLLEEGIKHRGSSMNRYLDLYGNKGSHQNHFRIYKRKNELCPVCETPIEFEKLNGRGSHYCPNCQPL